MHEELAVINNNPLRVFIPVVRKRLPSGLCQEPIPYVVGNSRNLCSGLCAANNELLNRCAFYFRQVGDGNARPLLLFYALNYYINQTVLKFFHLDKQNAKRGEEAGCSVKPAV